MSRTPAVPSVPFPASLSERYEALSMVGSGAFGTVFMARDRVLERAVAVKVLHGTVDTSIRRRFATEAALLARLHHPGLVGVFEHGESPGGPYMVMEYLEGATLSEQPPADPLATMLRVAEALTVVHQASLVHRDVKPENILSTREGRVVLIDFGLAFDPDRTRVTEEGMLLGTLAYLAPESIRGAGPGKAADWYAWGVTLFRLLEGRLPFTREDMAEVLQGDPLPVPTFSRVDGRSAVAELLRRCLSEDPSSRPASDEEVREMLRSSSGLRRRLRLEPAAAPLGTSRVSSAVQAPPPEGRRGFLLAGILLLLLGGCAFWFHARTLDPLPSGPVPPGAEASPELLALRQALELVGRGHRRTDGSLVVGAREGLVDDHVEEVMAELTDARLGARRARLLRSLEEWAAAAPVPEFERVVEIEVLPLLRHLAEDRGLARSRLAFPSVFAQPSHGREPAPVDAERIASRLDELRDLDLATHQRLAGKLDSVPGLCLASVLLSQAPPEARRQTIVSLLERSRRSSVAERLELMTFALQLLPDGAGKSEGWPCEDRESVVDEAQEAAGLPEAEAHPELGVRLDASLAWSLYDRMVSCRKQIGPEELEPWTSALDRLDLAVDRDPGRFSSLALYELGSVLAYYQLGGFMLSDFGPGFDAIMERIARRVDELRIRAGGARLAPRKAPRASLTGLLGP